MNEFYILPAPGQLVTGCPRFNASCNYSGAIIADFLTRGGVACYAISEQAAPQIDLFLFGLANYYSYSKLKRLLPALQAFVQAPVKLLEITAGAAFGLEIPRKNRQDITINNCICTDWEQASPAGAILGVDTNNSITALNLAAAPHILIAGTTGAGKSVLLNTILCSLLLHNSPARAKFVLVDPKKVEFTSYKSIPHLLQPIETSPAGAVAALENLANIMDMRYKELARAGLKNIDSTDLPRLFCVIDELADLMLVSRGAVENNIVRIAQLGRAAGVHLIIATQSPRANVITGLIRANTPCKIALACSTVRESMIILDHGGAEKLTGRGDCILKTGKSPKETRIQAAFTSDEQIAQICDFWERQQQPARPVHINR